MIYLRYRKIKNTIPSDLCLIHPDVPGYQSMMMSLMSTCMMRWYYDGPRQGQCEAISHKFLHQMIKMYCPHNQLFNVKLGCISSSDLLVIKYIFTILIKSLALTQIFSESALNGMDIFCGKLISIDICHKKVLFFYSKKSQSKI